MAYPDSRTALSRVKAAVHFRIAHYSLHVIASLRERDALHEFGGLAPVSPGEPSRDVSGSGVVGGERLLHASALVIQHGLQNRAAELRMGGRLIEHCAPPVAPTR